MTDKPSRSSTSGKGEKGSSSGGVGSGKSKNACKCVTCSQVVRDDDNGMQCEICEEWYHAKCQNINDEGYKVLGMENIHWYCIGCNRGIGKITGTLAKVQQKQEKLEREMKEMHDKVKEEFGKYKQDFQQEIKTIKDTINEMAAQIEQQKEDNSGEAKESLWSTIVSKQVEKKMETVTGEMFEVHKTIVETKQQIEEEREREKRKNNIIIYRMEESKATGPDTRRRDDLAFCHELVEGILEVDCGRDEIVNVFRLGKREVDYCRPVLVEFKKREIKNAVMESLAKLAEAEDRFKVLSVMHDMTKKEREDCKQLVAEARQQQNSDESGEFIYRVRGAPGEMKILRIRKRQRHVADNLQQSASSGN